MEKRRFLAIFGVLMIFGFGLMGCVTTDTTISENITKEVADPNALVGKWEGTVRNLNGRWSSYFALEIFAVDMNRKVVIHRRLCANCVTQQWYGNTPLIVKDGRVIFEEPSDHASGISGTRYELKGNRISGFATRRDGTAVHSFDYSLKRVPDVKRVFDPKELLGRWTFVLGNQWWELSITEVDSQNKTFKGMYLIGATKTEHVLSNAKLITDGDKLKVDFKTLNDTLHYQVAFYPSFGEGPPVLWGKLERMDGNVFYVMFRKGDKN